MQITQLFVTDTFQPISVDKESISRYQGFQLTDVNAIINFMALLRVTRSTFDKKKLIQIYITYIAH